MERNDVDIRLHCADRRRLITVCACVCTCVCINIVCKLSDNRVHIQLLVDLG